MATISCLFFISFIPEWNSPTIGFLSTLSHQSTAPSLKTRSKFLFFFSSSWYAVRSVTPDVLLAEASGMDGETDRAARRTFSALGPGTTHPAGQAVRTFQRAGCCFGEADRHDDNTCSLFAESSRLQ